MVTVEISIYSTCKRISQKILRNVCKFIMIVCDGDYHNLNFSVKRENMEEVNLQGPLGRQDVRIINSYPSKVKLVHAKVSFIYFISKSQIQKSTLASGRITSSTSFIIVCSHTHSTFSGSWSKTWTSSFGCGSSSCT